MTNRWNVVWVLGAGFSKSLGGPLLADLLSETHRRRLTEEYATVLVEGGHKPAGPGPEKPKLFASTEAEALYRLFSHGINAGMWHDAEQFLDYVDSQTRHETLRGDFGTLLQEALRSTKIRTAPLHSERLNHVAKRIIAAQCCVFLKRNPTSLERWQPYIRWISKLRHTDTIVSFNYDRVVETAANSPEAQKSGAAGIHVLTFDTSDNWDIELSDCKIADRPVLTKLHGSVDWKRDPTKQPPGRIPYRTSKQLDFAVSADPNHELAICTPGGSKQDKTDSDLKALWEYAKNKLKEAHAIVFLGYSFPRSDAKARAVIMDAIAENRYGGRRAFLKMHVVLGNYADAAARLKSLLVHAAERSGRRRPNSYEIVDQSLFVEDFLSVFDHDALCREP